MHLRYQNTDYCRYLCTVTYLIILKKFANKISTIRFYNINILYIWKKQINSLIMENKISAPNLRHLFNLRVFAHLGFTFSKEGSQGASTKFIVK